MRVVHPLDLHPRRTEKTQTNNHLLVFKCLRGAGGREPVGAGRSLSPPVVSECIQEVLSLESDGEVVDLNDVVKVIGAEEALVGGVVIVSGMDRDAFCLLQMGLDLKKQHISET